MARAIVFCAAWLAGLAACGGSSDVKPSLGASEPCLEQPGVLDRPPTGKLPCELLPPTR